MRRFRYLQIKAGRFKIPFGREQLTGLTETDFIYRSGISTYLAPGRDVGADASALSLSEGARVAGAGSCGCENSGLAGFPARH